MAGVTVPPAAGEAEIVNCTSGEKFAVMLWAALIVTVVAALAMLATGPVVGEHVPRVRRSRDRCHRPRGIGRAGSDVTVPPAAGEAEIVNWYCVGNR